MDLVRLIKAVLTRAYEREGYVTKTKLLKYLYLFDLEHYRRFGTTLTGFAWMFHFYGPWTKEFEDLYGDLVKRGHIQVKEAVRPDLEAEIVLPTERLDLADEVEDVSLELAFRRIVDTWAERRLGELLDYVYFHTEPMQRAVRGDQLDFSQVERGIQSSPTIAPQPSDRSAIERMRRAIAARRQQSVPSVPVRFTPPPYDEHYFEALRGMDEDDGY